MIALHYLYSLPCSVTMALHHMALTARTNVSSTLLCIIVLLFSTVMCADIFQHTEIRCAPNESPRSQSQSNPRVAIAFFGISRNLKLTLPLFEKYVFGALGRHGIQSDVYWHTVTKHSISNIHTTERNEELNRFDVQLMNPCVFELADEGVVKEAEFAAFKKSRLDGHNKSMLKFDPFHKYFHDNYESLQNMLCAFHSQFRLHQMISNRMRTMNITYDAILVLRPDTGVMFRDIDLPKFLPGIRNNELKGVWTPDFQRWKGLNDRFAFGDVSSMLMYLSRGERYKQKADKITEGSGEKFLKKYLRRQGINSYDSKVRVMRIRASGVVARKDCLDESIRKNYGEQLKNCITWVRGRDSAAASDDECRILNIKDC